MTGRGSILVLTPSSTAARIATALMHSRINWKKIAKRLHGPGHMGMLRFTDARVPGKNNMDMT